MASKAFENSKPAKLFAPKREIPNRKLTPSISHGVGVPGRLPVRNRDDVPSNNMSISQSIAFTIDRKLNAGSLAQPGSLPTSKKPDRT